MAVYNLFTNRFNSSFSSGGVILFLNLNPSFSNRLIERVFSSEVIANSVSRPNVSLAYLIIAEADSSA